VGGWSIAPGFAYALTTQALPDSTEVWTPAGPGPAGTVAEAVRLAVSGGTVHLGRLLAAAGVRFIVVVDGLAPTDGNLTATVAAPPPAGLQRALLDQNDLQIVPGVFGVQVYENGEDIPVTAQRATALPAPTTALAFPSAADAVGWQPVLTALANAPATGPVAAGTLYAGYAPAGSFTLTVDGHRVARRPAFGWAGQYPGVPAGPAQLSFSRPPRVPLVVLLELIAWFLLGVALLGWRRWPFRLSRLSRPEGA
jgi:hypothetical protein